MPFEKGSNPARKSRPVLHQKSPISESAVDPWLVVLKVRSWAAQLREGRVRSRAEMARREAITRASVSQLWPLSEIMREEATRVQKRARERRIAFED
jgi:hypothetical protein